MKDLFLKKSLTIRFALLSVMLMGITNQAMADADFDPRPPVDPEYHYYYPVTVSVYPEGAGWASGAGKYEAGTSIWLSTSGNSGYEFSHWEKDGVECSSQSSFRYTMGDERPNFVAVYEYKPSAPSDPQNTYEPKKRLYLTCAQSGCSFNMTSGEKRVIGRTLNIQAYLDAGYTVVGWYEGDSLIATTSGFNYVMPDHDVTLRIDIEYNPMIPGDPASVGGNIALEADNLDDIDPYVANSLFYFEKTSFTYTGKPLALGYYSRLNPTVEPLDELETQAGTYTARIDVAIKNDSIDTHRVFDFEYTITQVELTASAGEYTKTYGDENPAFTVQYKGFVNGETAAVLTTEPQASTAAGKESGVGDYVLELSGGTARNYLIKTSNGKLTVTKAPIVITPKDTVITYGQTISAGQLDYTVSGFVNGDTISCFKTSPAVKIEGDGIDAGEYTITASGAEADNYSIAYGTGLLTVRKAALTIAPKDILISYGTDFRTLRPEFVYDGFVYDETESSLDALPVVVIADTISTVGVYDITASGAQALNYEIIYGIGKLTIDKLALTFAVKDATREYGEANPQFEYVIKDSIGSVLNVTAPVNIKLECSAGPTAGVGEYDIVATITFDSLNYIITAVNGKLTVTPATLTVTAIDTMCVEGTSVFDLAYRIEGFKNGEDESVLTRKPVVTCNVNGNTPAGDYTITASGAEADNYVFVYVDGNLNLYNTGVTGIEVDAVYPVYDLTGRLIGTTADDLKPGIYIINGHKFMK